MALLELRAIAKHFGAIEALKGVDLDLEAGEVLGLMGDNGAGKSTLVKIIAGNFPPSEGEILLDGIDLREYKVADLRRQFAIVLQEPILFATTIAENIAYARPRASEEEVREAARRAGLDEFVDDLPEGYETLVGERGLTLSGGQRQRLALARALVRRPRLLVLDEATSAVDAETERAIFANLRGLGCTLIVIAHRLSTVRDAHQIVVMDQGRIVERGTHHDLCAAGGRYAALTEHQHTRHEPVPA